MERDRLGHATGDLVGQGQVVAADQRVGVVGAELRVLSLSVSSWIGIASSVRPASVVGQGEVVAAGERVGVVGAELAILSLSVSSSIAIASSVRPAAR